LSGLAVRSERSCFHHGEPPDAASNISSAPSSIEQPSPPPVVRLSATLESEAIATLEI